MLTNTISNEVLAIGAKTPLVGLIKDYITTMRSLWPDYPSNANQFNYNRKEWKDATKLFTDSIRKLVGPIVAIDVYGGTEHYNMGLTSQIWFNGHSGSRWYASPEQKIYVTDGTSINEYLEIDLKNVTIKGTLVDQLQFRLYYTESIMFNASMFTIEEVTAVMLHEFGHLFDNFVTLGDYAWLNYYLTDGVEILMGKKPNKLKLQILSDDAIKALVAEEDYDNFVNDRNENNTKRVILSLAKKAPRHHLTDNTLLANRREEQLADLFASRLGYGRAIAQFNFKYDKYYGDPDYVGTQWYLESIKALFMVAALPVTTLAVMLHDPLNGGKDGRYDNQIQRITKLRRDLIAQLRYPGPLDKDGIIADISAIDDILKEYAGNRTLFNGLIEFFRPSLRKQMQNTKVEEDLESLFHNDLFVQAFKLSKI